MNKVFISYSIKDKELARQLAYKLQRYKILAFLDEFEIGYSFSFGTIFSKLEAGDFWVIFLSGSSSTQNIGKDIYIKAQKQLHNRNISIVPILVSGQNIPPEFKDRKSFNIKANHEIGLDTVARYLRNVPNVDFDLLTPHSFEDLVIALLEKLRFKNIEVASTSSDYGYDIKATSTYRDPFGNKHDVNWLIELKFYRESRADIQALSQLSHYLIDLPPNYNGVLITNGQLTSAAKDWLRENERSKRTRITIIDGMQLRELLLKHDDLVEVFFSSRG